MSIGLYLVLGALVIAGIIASITRRSATSERPTRGMASKKTLRRTLVARLLGDEAAARRLIEFERARTPEASEKELIDRAIRRLERDRRR
jgi:hypothetical protein